MDGLLKWFENTDPSIVALVLMTILVIAVVWSWHRNPNMPIDLSQVLVDSVTGKISVEKVAFMTALAISTWGFVTLILRNAMTEWFFTAYVGVFVLGRFGSQGLSVWKSKDAKDAANPPA